MSEFVLVVSPTRIRVCAGTDIALLEPGVPRSLKEALARTAVAAGASYVTEKSLNEVHEPPPPEPTPKKRVARKKKPLVEVQTVDPLLVISQAADKIEELMKDDVLGKEAFAPSGAPRVAALREHIPHLTADQRDKAWDMVTAR